MPEMDLTADLSARVLLTEQTLRVRSPNFTFPRLSLMLSAPFFEGLPLMSSTSQAHLYVHRKVSFIANPANNYFPFHLLTSLSVRH